VKLVVRDGCPHCSYILSLLESSNIKDAVEVVKVEELDPKLRRKVKSTPSIIVKGKVIPLTGTLHGFIKLSMYVLKYSRR
jgi:glutaredoxin